MARIADHYNAVLRRAGGDSAWLKRGARPAPPADSQAPDSNGNAVRSNGSPFRGEALALAAAVPLMVSGLERQAASDGLAVDAEPQGQATATATGAPDTIVTLARSGRRICAWRIREVPRLYRAAIVIDDLGQQIGPVHDLLGLPYALTFSVLPRLPASREASADASRAGREVMLHLPMEPLGAGINPGAGAILVGMRAPDVARTVEADLESVPDARGVNNHMGSRATSDPALMAAVMKELSSKRLYFIDSRTAPSTVAFDAARRAGIPAFYRSVFLDDTETVEYTLGQLRSFRSLVERQGSALAIGHPHPTTIRALEAFLPELDRDDIEIVPASRLVGASGASRIAAREAGAGNAGD